MKHNLRTIAIAKILLEGVNDENSSLNAYTTINDIAVKLGVSTKTVSRELTSLEELLAEHNLQLVKKYGEGMKLEGSAEDLNVLSSALQEQTGEGAYTSDERRSIIISNLLTSQEPIKLFALSSTLKVTDGTISNDLDKLEAWFAKQSLQLVRKPGLGVYLEGDERSLRKAIIKHIYDNVDEKKLLSMVDETVGLGNDENDKSNEKRSKGAMSHLLNLMDKQIINKLEGLIQEAETELATNLPDQAFVGLVVHLSLAVQRIRKQESIHIDSELLKILKTNKEYAVAKSLADKIQEVLEMEVPIDEVGYITMHLLGARNSYRKEDTSMTVMEKFHLVRLAKSIMTAAEKETGKKLSKSTSLLAGLVNHLGPSISRLTMGMDIRNPLLSEMQTTYPDLMELSRKCVGRLEKLVGKTLPDSEIAYIAMHLGAAMLENENAERRTFRAVIACPTGMGTSRLLAGRIKNAFSELKIVDVASTLKLTEEYLKECEADIVIATVPVLDVGIPQVVVNSLLTDEDMGAIKAHLKQLNMIHSAKVVKEEDNSNLKTQQFISALDQMAQYSQAIVQLLNNFFLAEMKGEANILAVCEKVAELVSDREDTRKGIIRGLLDRESKGSTLIRGTNMILLHCASRYTDSLRFGVIHLTKGFYYPEISDGSKEEKLKTIMVMLAPMDASQLYRDTIGHIASILMERWGLIELLHKGDKESIHQELTLIFREFYQGKYEELFKK